MSLSGQDSDLLVLMCASGVTTTVGTSDGLTLSGTCRAGRWVVVVGGWRGKE